MAKKYLSLERLTEYDALLKATISDSDASTLESAKGYADEKLATLTSGTTTVAKAEEATHATSADTATNATNATNAVNSEKATNADNATKATQDAKGNVIDAIYETKSDATAKLTEAKGYTDEKLATLTSGTTTVAKAEEATHATSADTATNATNANHAASADNATNAVNATNATNATNAVNATKATQDAEGNVIDTTYETKSDASAKLTEAKDYTDQKLANLTSGTTTVAKATEATKATQDASGNVITATYETKSDAEAKLTEAKGYADSVATKVKNDLLNGAGEAYDTLKELGDLINDNQDAIGALETVAAGKADKEHEHTVSDITDYVAPVQSNWNQNDETALDYVQNRPCYFEDPVDTVLIEETTLNFDDWNSNVIEGGSVFEVGKTYTVVYDGVTYECVAWESPYGDGMIGNGGLYEIEGAETDDPFLFECYDGAYFITTSTDGDHTISMSAMISEVVELDEKFISYKPGTKVEPGVYYVYDPFEDTDVEITVNVGGEIFNRGLAENFAADYAHAEGSFAVAAGVDSHAEGNNTKTLGEASHAEGHGTYAIGDCSHAEGREAVAKGEASHAEGAGTAAVGVNSHAEGDNSEAYGESSHAEGCNTIAASDYQHVQGMHNIVDEEGRYAHIVGNGWPIYNPDARSNAHTLDWEGNAWFAGDVYVGGRSQDDEEAAKLLTEYDLSWDKLHDKPFGEQEASYEITNEIALYTGETYEFNDWGQGYYVGYARNPQNYTGFFNQDRFYGVIWDGELYVCPVFYDESLEGNYGYHIGAPLGDVVVGPTEIPFNMRVIENGVVNITTYETDPVHEIDIFEFEGTYISGVIKTIDLEYLPEQLQFGVVQEAIVDISKEKELRRTMSSSFQDLGYNCYSAQSTSASGYMSNIEAFDPNKFYRVVWDDVDYICKPIYDDSVESGAVYSLGSKFKDVVAGTAKPNFNIYFKFKGSIMMHTSDMVSGSHRVGIYECEGTYQEEIINKIDPKYLPEIDLNGAVEDSNSYTDEAIAKLVNGTTAVAKATSASDAEKLGGQLPSYYAAASAIPTGALADKSVVSESDLDSALAEKVNAAAEGNHSHANKTVLDGITADKVSAWDGVSSKANQSDLTSHTDNTTVHITADERTKWNTASTTANEAKYASEANTESINAHTASINAHTTAITNLQTAVAEFEEVTSEEIAALFV